MDTIKTDANPTNVANESSKYEEKTVPIIFIIPQKGNYQGIAKELLVVLAINKYQHKKIKDASGKERYVLQKQEDIVDKIYEMTDGNISIAQSTVSKCISLIRNRTIDFDGKIFTIENRERHYFLTEVLDPSEQIHPFIEPNDVFFNHPYGTSTIFAIKTAKENQKAVQFWLRRTISRDLFQMFVKDDTIICLLRVDSQTFKRTSQALKNALTNQGLTNTNYTLRNIAKSWKQH